VDNAAVFFGLLVIALALFLIGREFVGWYFKVNKVVSLLQRIADELETRP
jgi:hypothetical protein